ncbi:VWA domain-containing protein [Clostridium thermarum]|uniref:VWA domain-containing protein n=1 Tax=Clostridium thermarum TaxID=1716543 RepID=UPI0013D2BCA9|nr:VWA domain-containing protein [Clostridium thermarum]
MKFRKNRIIIFIVLAAMSLLYVGCGKKDISPHIASDGIRMESSAKASSGASTEAPAPAVNGKVAMEVGTSLSDTAEFTASKDASAPENHIQQNQQIASGQLTAGEWKDFKNWDYWLNLLNNGEWKEYQSRWQFFTRKKLQVIVKDGDKPVVDVKVYLLDKQGNILWTSKTDNKGVACLFPELFSPGQNTVFDIIIEDGQNNVKLEDIKASVSEPVYVDFKPIDDGSNILDLMFVVDTTGSMQDELDYLKAELKNVIRRVDAEASQSLDIRLSCNYYRDQGDEYVVRPFPFTRDIDEVINDMNKQYADGGGDTPEAVVEALQDAIENHQWSVDAGARLLFLVLDAPPHYTTENVTELQNLIAKASAAGIRIIPVASSGIDKETEALLRFFSISTGGTYTFLTDHSGIGNDHIEPTIGDYQVELLNDLLVRIIKDYTSK